MSGDHNQYQKGTSYLALSKDGKEIELVVSHDFECPRCGHCCYVDADDTSQNHVDEIVKAEHEKQVGIAQAYERGWNAALAQQEPVAWIHDGGKGELWWYQSSKFDEEGNLIGPNPDDIPLYTAPQPALKTKYEQARSLTDELMDCVDRLGSEADTVDPRVWQHLLVYAPQKQWVGLTDEEIDDLLPEADGTTKELKRKLEYRPGLWGDEVGVDDAWSKSLVIEIIRAVEKHHGIGVKR